MTNQEIIDQASSVKVLADYFRSNAGWKPLTMPDGEMIEDAINSVNIVKTEVENFIAVRFEDKAGKFVVGIGFENQEMIFDTDNENEFNEAVAEL